MADIFYVNGTDLLRDKIAQDFGQLKASHIHLDDGFTFAAVADGDIAGFISVQWRLLPSPLSTVREGYIDIIEVVKDLRHQGIGRKLIELVEEVVTREGMYQLRAWSSDDKGEAINMWKVLGFGLCPAVTYSRNQEVKGYYAVKVIRKQL